MHIKHGAFVDVGAVFLAVFFKWTSLDERVYLNGRLVCGSAKHVGKVVGSELIGWFGVHDVDDV